MTFHFTQNQNLNFNVMVIFFMLLLQSFAFPLSAQDEIENYKHLLKGYPEVQKNQLMRVISFTTQKHPGKVVGITRQIDNDATYFKVKLLNSEGELKTYYIDKNISEINP